MTTTTTPVLRLLWVVAMLCLIFGAPTTLAQTCEAITDSACAQVVPPGTYVFVPPGFTSEILVNEANSVATLASLAALAEPCYSYAVQYFCATWLRPCHKDANNATIPIPREPCNLVCQAYYNNCHAIPPYTQPNVPIGYGAYFPSGSFPLNCSAIYPDPYASNITFYPYNYTDTQYGGVNYSVSCAQNELVTPPLPTICHDPLTVTKSPTRAALQCAFSCPLPSLTDSQYTNVKNLQGTVGWLSWCATAFLIIFLLFFPKARAFPRNMILMTAFAANIAAGAIILPTYAGYDNTWCGGTAEELIPHGAIVGTDEYGLPIIRWFVDDDTLTFESSLCTFQGAMLQFGFLAAVFWWVLIAFNMSLELYFKRMWNLDQAKWKWTRFIVYLFIGWGLPFVLMVIPAGAGKIAFPPGGTYCFVTNEDNYAWSLTFWFVPVGISLLLGVSLFIAALVRVTILLITIKKVMKLIGLYLRLLIFIFLYLTMFVFITAYNIQVANNQSKISTGYEDYYDCLILGRANCELSKDISNYDLVMLKAWAISSLGLLLFFTFLTWDTIKFWYNLCKAIVIAFYHRNPKEVMSILHMLTYNSSTRTTLHSDTSNTLTIDPAVPPDEEDGDELDEEVDTSSSGSSSEE